MDHSGMDMSDMDMDMGDGMLSISYYQRMYWAVVGTAIAVASIIHLLNIFISRQRLSEVKRSRPTPARPKHVLVRAYATMTAVTREIAYTTPPLVFRLKRYVIYDLRPMGQTILILSYLVVLVVFSFYKLDTKDKWQWEDIGYRTGYVSVCQLPLIFLLAGKRNIIGFLTGHSYERLNWLHRWVSRGLFLTTTIHMGYWFTSWARWDYVKVKVKTDPITQKGLGAWIVLAWIVLSSMAPIRHWCYELFVLQHLLSFTALVAMIYLHVPKEHHIYVWIPVGLFFFDRLVRAANILYNNLSIFRQRTDDKRNGFWACKAEITPLADGITRITVPNPPILWKPGQHIFLSCHSIIPLQNHPFTISSLPKDGKMEILVRAKKGGTRRLFGHAEKYHVLPTVEREKDEGKRKTTVTIEGPYGRIRPLRQFDSVVFFAGGIGATFTIPLLRDLVGHCLGRESSDSRWPTYFSAMPAGAVTRHVRLVWVVKSSNQLSWFATQLNQVLEDVAGIQQTQARAVVQIEISIYVTCDETLTNPTTKPVDYSIIKGDEESQTPSNESQSELSKITEESASANPEKAKETNKLGSCLPDGTCCCTTVITNEEDAITTTTTTTPKNNNACTCGSTNPPAPSSTSSSFSSSSATSSSSSPSRSLHPKITLFTGRPHPESIIRRTLEQAQGESAVVVCGPTGLAENVRTTVARLSDERAVHKGTGAQGVWCWCEAYGY
ncbi:MAG: hypothetical protein M1816_007377 [Peltula sp. TS41687]|nr:MAG: hypothetical protein M1816_007377 [Peltula sp. TS41687]